MPHPHHCQGSPQLSYATELMLLPGTLKAAFRKGGRRGRGTNTIALLLASSSSSSPRTLASWTPPPPSPPPPPPSQRRKTNDSARRKELCGGGGGCCGCGCGCGGRWLCQPPLEEGREKEVTPSSLSLPTHPLLFGKTAFFLYILLLLLLSCAELRRGLRERERENG